MTFKFVELFAGIGGFRQGLSPLGGECVLASEWDKHASQAYSILYGGEYLHGDVTKVIENDVTNHDLLVFGMPCQAFSVAGKRLGFEDMRGTLYFEAMRIAKAKKPKVLWMENVKGLVSHDGGRTLEVMAQAMSDLGYVIDFEVLDSKYFGVAQGRKRIFMVGVRDDLEDREEWNVGKRSDVVAKSKRRIAKLGVNTFNFDWPEQNEVTVRLRDILESDVDEKYYLSEEKTANLVAQLDSEGMPEGKIDSPHMIGMIDIKGQENIRRVYNTEAVGPTLTTMGGGHREPKIAEEQTKRSIQDFFIENSFNQEQKGNGFRFSPHVKQNAAVAKTLTTRAGGRMDDNFILENEDTAKEVFTFDSKNDEYKENKHYRIRKLTPRECFRLQGFPDAEFDKLTANGISNSQLYKMAGNAVTVNVISAIGKRLLPYISE